MRDINPINNNGSIQLKFSYAGKRYSFNPIPGASYKDKRDLKTANAIATKIQNDILAGCFDSSLDRYRLVPKVAERLQPTTLLQLWDVWVDCLQLAPATKADHYEMVRRMIIKANPKLEDITWLTCSPLAPSTINKRLGYISACFKWAVKEGLVTTNPFDNVKLKQTPHPSDIKPFSLDEISQIVAGFDQQAPHYSPFIQFLFLTGCRLSEAIGFRWGSIDFEQDTVTFSESLAKDRTGNGYTRVRKGTKTGNSRTLKMSSQLRALMRSLKPATKPNVDQLVFTTVKGCTIDSGNFRELWVRVLDICNIPYRRIHIIRHTTLSHAIEQGCPLTGVAYVAGHSNTRMVMQTYGHMINRPSLPDMPV